MPDLCIFGLYFKHNIVIFDINTLEFATLQNLVRKQKGLNLAPKMPYFSIVDQKCCLWLFMG